MLSSCVCSEKIFLNRLLFFSGNGGVSGTSGERAGGLSSVRRGTCFTNHDGNRRIVQIFNLTLTKVLLNLNKTQHFMNFIYCSFFVFMYFHR